MPPGNRWLADMAPQLLRTDQVKGVALLLVSDARGGGKRHQPRVLKHHPYAS